jgi:hypothetical protein
MRPVFITLAHWVHQLALSLWLGGILIIGAVVAPSVFGTARAAGDTQSGMPLFDFAGQVMTEAFRRFNWVVLAAGALMLICGLASGLPAPVCRKGVLARAALTAVAWAGAAWLTFGLFPQLLEARAAGNDAAFKSMHETYSMGFKAQMFLLLAIAAVTAWIEHGKRLATDARTERVNVNLPGVKPVSAG